jgi:tetratricopeptide (TPR) repeat protein
MGVAGVGKSRLVSELFASLGGSAWVLSGRCLHYGEGITFWPLIEALARIGDPAQGVLDRLGSGGATAPEELFWAVRQLLESLAVDRSVILHIEDLQWAQPMLFDLIDHVADLSRGAPILLLCTARPDLLEDRPAWGGGKLNATTMLLEPLAATESEELLDEIGDGLDADARSRIVGAAGGNPLFLEEMVALAHELGTIEVPSTIQALLAARLEQLPNEERELLECAAIEGDVFHPTAVRALASERLTAELQPRLAALVRKELIRPHTPALEGGQAFRFRHILLRDAAYDALPKATRTELHERFATWTEQNARELPELDEIVGWHLQQALRYRSELGPVDHDYVLLADHAGDCLAAAGRRAMSRGDASAAVTLLRGSAGAFEAAGHTRSEVLVELGSALAESGQLRDAEDHLRRALEQARSTGAEGVAARAMIELSDLHSVLDSQARVTESEEVAKRAIAVFTRVGDEGGLARAWLHIADVHWTRCCFAKMEEVLEQALVHAEGAGIRREQSRILTHFARAAVMGPRPVDDAIARCNGILARADDDIYLGAMTETMLAVLEAMQGRSDAARDRWQRAARRLEDIGLNVTVALLQIYRALIELLSEGPIDIEPDLAETCALLQRMGERSRLASAAALLARLLYVSERYDDCARYGQISADAVTPDDVASRILWQGTRAKLLARADDRAFAEEVAGGAVALAEQTDSLLLIGDALRDRAEVRTILNNPDSAIGDLRRAIELYDRKGIRVSPGLRNAASAVASS